MSAFFVDVDHVNAMLTAVSVLQLGRGPVPGGPKDHYAEISSPERLTEIGRALLLENVKSLRSRYPGARKEHGEYADTAARYRFKFDDRWASRVDLAIATIKLCDCYDYQACEHKGWRASYARTFSNWLVRNAAKEVRGYDNAPWGF